MSALGSYLEDEGLATTGISLIREHSEHMQPPRALWVPFPLGRPLGAPGDAGFQRRVLLAALDLLRAERGPVLADFPDDAPSGSSGAGGTGGPGEPDDSAGFSCPVSLPPPGGAGDDPAAAVRREVAALAPWYAVGCRERGGTAVGASGLDLDGALAFVAAVAAGGPVPPADRPAEVLRLAAKDLEAYYVEAVTAQPGSAPPDQIGEWFWRATALGDLLRAASAACRASADEELRRVGGWSLVPQAHEAAPGAWQPVIPKPEPGDAGR